MISLDTSVRLVDALLVVLVSLVYMTGNTTAEYSLVPELAAILFPVALLTSLAYIIGKLLLSGIRVAN